MRRRPRLVLDTNVVISAILWGGKPGEMLAMAGEGEVQLYSSLILLEELRATLERPKLSKALAATGLGIPGISTIIAGLSPLRARLHWTRLGPAIRMTTMSSLRPRSPSELFGYRRR